MKFKKEHSPAGKKRKLDGFPFPLLLRCALLVLVVQYVHRAGRLNGLAIVTTVGAYDGQAKGEIVQVGVQGVKKGIACEFFLDFMRTYTLEEADWVNLKKGYCFVLMPVRDSARYRQCNMPCIAPPNP